MNNSDFHHLHVHTEYSVLDGLSQVEELVTKAKTMGFRSLAITDHGTMQGAVHFYNACKSIKDENGNDVTPIKPIIGIEAYVCRDMESKEEKKSHHIILLAKNQDGYSNLMKMCTDSYLKGFYYRPRIDLKYLAQHSKGIICSSACIDGVVSNLILDKKPKEALDEAMILKEIFKDDFYLEAMYHKMSEEKIVIKGLLDIAKSTGIKVICTNDAHYINKEDAFSQEVLMAIEMRRSMNDPERYHLPTDEFYLKSADEMASIFHPELSFMMQNTNEIYDKVDFKFGKSEMLLPKLDIPKEFPDEHSYMCHLAREGLQKIGKAGDSEYVKRLEYEIGCIETTGFSKYFIMVWDYVNFCIKNNIPIGPGRGSGCGSLVVLCLGITKIDPVKYNLLFERFINVERVSWPDLDIDFAHNRRDKVFNYIIEKYGRERTGKIGTNQSFKARSAIRAAAKHIDPFNDFKTGEKRSLAFSDEISKLVPNELKMTLKKGCEEVPELAAYKKKYPKIFEVAERLEGMATRSSIHAAGIVVAPGPLTDHVPLHITRGCSKGERDICTQYPMAHLEKIGLVKFDILGLNTLTVIERCLQLIEEKFNFKVDLDLIPMDDQPTLDLFKRGDTDCIFQMESYGMKRLLQDMKANTFEDVIAANALYRPGALQAGAHEKYATCKLGKAQIERIHPDADEILEPTYGQIVYQEQVMKIAREIAGFTGGQADELRKAIGKKQDKLFASNKERFIDGCKKLGKVSDEMAANIWQKFEFFGGYGFNKAHSTAYGLIAYQTAYLKCHYPIQFMCATLTIEAMDRDYDKVEEYKRSCGRMNIPLLPMDINKSKTEFVEEGNGIRIAFLSAKGVAEKSAREIEKHQPYSGLEDFCMKTDGFSVNQSVVAALVENDALEKFGKAHEILDAYILVRKTTDKVKESGNSMFDLSAPVKNISEYAKISRREKNLKENYKAQVVKEQKNSKKMF